MAKTAAQLYEDYIEQQVRETAGKPTWAELIERIRSRPGHKPYEGPPPAEIIRADRDSH